MKPLLPVLFLVFLFHSSQGQSYPVHLETEVDLFKHLMTEADLTQKNGASPQSRTFILVTVDQLGAITGSSVVKETDPITSNICLSSIVKIKSFGNDILKGNPKSILFSFIVSDAAMEVPGIESDLDSLKSKHIIDSNTLILNPYISTHFAGEYETSGEKAVSSKAYKTKHARTLPKPAAPSIVVNIPTNRVSDENSPTAQRQYGLEMMDSGEYDKAIKALSYARRGYLHDPVIYNNRGLAYFKTGNSKKACKDWKKAVELGHNESQALIEAHCD